MQILDLEMRSTHEMMHSVSLSFLVTQILIQQHKPPPNHHIYLMRLNQLKETAWAQAHKRYDLVIVARRECFDDIHQKLSRHRIPSKVPVVFDTVDLHFLREQRRAQFRRDHASQVGHMIPIHSRPGCVLMSPFLNDSNEEFIVLTTKGHQPSCGAEMVPSRINQALH